MKDICELCSLCSPNMGCTKLKDESCLKEAIKLIKPSVTNGEVFLRGNETAQVYGIDKEKDIIKVCFDNENIVPISYSWWNRKWGE